ncbi:hypothetical protein MRBLWH7_000494 [Microbacterium sp. LWH7-1.2]|uniref:hypothetical protein n=1 Tax=Microbacterium sp. LWH7-1.2 TaxID=3135257 RepID=UPI00313867C3
MPRKTTTHLSRRPYAAIALTAAISPLAACAGPATVPPTTAPQETETNVPQTSAYVDGEHSARGWYGSLPSHQDVTLTIDDGAVTEVQITTPAEDETSLGYQQRFAQALPGAIIGRSLDEIAIDRLAGASGCSEGFMNALTQIREAATKN